MQAAEKNTERHGKQADRLTEKDSAPRQGCAAILLVQGNLTSDEIRQWVEKHARGITTPLMTAAALGNHGEVDRLLDSGNDVNEINEAGCTALMWAAMSQNKETVNRLVQGGADVNQPDNVGRTALMISSTAASVPIVSELVAAGANINAAQTGQAGAIGFTPLMHAAASNRLEVVETLLDAGADLDPTSELGWAALSVAATRSSVPVIAVLVEAGADVNVASTGGYYWPSGQSPLMLAAYYNHQPEEAVRYLIKAGADVNQTDADGRTALMYASSSRQEVKREPEIHVPMAKALVEAGANINAASTGGKDSQGYTALMVGARDNQLELVKYLLSVGADPKIQNAQGETAYQIAEKQNNPAVAKLFREQ
ncbi:MAG: hypothetical protein GY807_00030 [Gammaproteobacteria bacterium]|nr:hypothetical protein [Gammaproteobacteria bacterium]